MIKAIDETFNEEDFDLDALLADIREPIPNEKDLEKGNEIPF